MQVPALDSASATWSTLDTIGSLPTERFCHTASLQDEGTVLVFGGFDGEAFD